MCIVFVCMSVCFVCVGMIMTKLPLLPYNCEMMERQELVKGSDLHIIYVGRCVCYYACLCLLLFE